MSEQTPEPAAPADIDIDPDELDPSQPIEPPASSDPAQMVDEDIELGGVGGPDAGGAG